jgi:hypothetical protein
MIGMGPDGRGGMQADARTVVGRATLAREVGSRHDRRLMVSLGEFVIVDDGRCGVLVPPPSSEGLLAVWFGERVEDKPVVEVVQPTRVRRLEETDAPVYYH